MYQLLDKLTPKSEGTGVQCNNLKGLIFSATSLYNKLGRKKHREWKKFNAKLTTFFFIIVNSRRRMEKNGKRRKTSKEKQFGQHHKSKEKYLFEIYPSYSSSLSPKEMAALKEIKNTIALISLWKKKLARTSGSFYMMMMMMSPLIWYFKYCKTEFNNSLKK